MADASTEVREHEVPEWPGWTKIVLGNSRRYRSPGGVDISASRFMKLATEFRGQKYIPESRILEDVKDHAPDAPRGFMKDIGASPRKKKEELLDDVPRQQTIEEIAANNEPHTGKSTIGGKRHLRPSQQALAAGFKNVLLIITAYVIAGMVIHDDRAALSEQEATVIGIALSNLLKDSEFNEKYGWMVADTGDWQALGVVAFTYFSRLNDIRKERVAAAKQQKQGVPQQQYQPQPTSSNGNGNQPVQNFDGRPIYPATPVLRSGGVATPITRPQGGQ